jgi:hypothetical protein
MANHSTQTLIDLYGRYSAMLYGIALQIAPSDVEAAQILLTTFEKAQEQIEVENNGHCIWVALIKLNMTTARQQMEGRFNNHNLPNLFPANPLLRKVLFENKTIRQLRNETNLTLEEFGKMMREELHTIRDANEAVSANCAISMQMGTGLFDNV